MCESYDATQRKRSQVVHSHVSRDWFKTNSPTAHDFCAINTRNSLCTRFLLRGAGGCTQATLANERVHIHNMSDFPQAIKQGAHYLTKLDSEKEFKLCVI